MILGDDNDNYVKNVTRAVDLNKQHIKMQHFSMLMSRHRLTVLLKILHCSQLANFMGVGKHQVITMMLLPIIKIRY